MSTVYGVAKQRWTLENQVNVTTRSLLSGGGFGASSSEQMHIDLFTMYPNTVSSTIYIAKSQIME
jgi:hypothetical protein